MTTSEATVCSVASERRLSRETADGIHRRVIGWAVNDRMKRDLAILNDHSGQSRFNRLSQHH